MKLTSEQLNELKELNELGFVRIINHPNLPLRIVKYSYAVQYKFKPEDWSPLLKMCRGLILDDENNIIAKGFDKFFNYQEDAIAQINLKIPDNIIGLYDKADGTQILMFFYNNEWIFTTAGTFNTIEAKYAKQIFENMYEYDYYSKTKTHIFELISPKNKFIVKYDRDALIYIGRIDNNSLDDEILANSDVHLPYNGYEDDFSKRILNTDIHGKEGFVVRFKNGYRTKVKFNSYLELHKKYMKLTERGILIELSKNNLIEYLGEVPDEFYSWVKEKASIFIKQFEKIQNDIKNGIDELIDYSQFYDFPQNKVMLKQRIAGHQYARIIMKSLYNEISDEDLNKYIWKEVDKLRLINQKLNNKSKPESFYGMKHD